MTKELLNEIQNDYWNEKADPIDMAEVFDLAIKALEQQPCEDCISRAETLRHGRLIYDDDGIGYSVVRVDEIEQLPSVTPSYNSVKTELEPSADCISRAKALEMLGDEPENWTDTENEIQEVNDYRWFKSILEELPLVTPQQKIGKWIKDCGKVKCSCCGYYIDDDYYAKAYCTNCGAKMEVEE